MVPLANLIHLSKSWYKTNLNTNTFEKVMYNLAPASIFRMPSFMKPFGVMWRHPSLHQALHFARKPTRSFNSKEFSKAELNYAIHEQEMLVSICTIQTWRCYLDGGPFMVMIKAYPCTFFKTQPTLNEKQAQWPQIF